MVKKSLSVFIFAVFVTGGISAQSKNALSIDIAPLLKGVIASDSDAKTSFLALGVFYEHAVGDAHLAIGVRADIISAKINNVNGLYFGVDAHSRYYPLAQLEKLFFDAGLGFNSANLDGSELFSGLIFGIKTGWKYFVIKNIFVEPAIGYVYSKSNAVFQTAPLGWQLGLSAGMNF